MDSASILILLAIFSRTFAAQNSTLKPQVIEAKLNQTYTNVIDSSQELIYQYKNVQDSGLRVFSQVDEMLAREDFPILIVVNQQKGVLSWQIPFHVRRDDNHNFDRYYSVNRTLCPIENNPKLLSSDQRYVCTVWKLCLRIFGTKKRFLQLLDLYVRFYVRLIFL